jgi:hypothetical protein
MHHNLTIKYDRLFAAELKKYVKVVSDSSPLSFMLYLTLLANKKVPPQIFSLCAWQTRKYNEPFTETIANRV